MAVSFAAEPKGSRAALEDGLRSLAGNPTRAAQAHLAATAGAQAPPPLPVHIFPLDELAAGNDPRGTAPIAWAYLLVTNDQPVRTAEVLHDPQGAFTFAAISGGQTAGVARAIEVAEAAPATAAGNYELRLVRAPALYVTAVWLKDRSGKADDFFVVVPPAPEGFQSHILEPAADFLKKLQSHAAAKVRLSPPVSTSSPTN
jgi:hypothetical protein